MDRASASGAEGRWFESSWAHQYNLEVSRRGCAPSIYRMRTLVAILAVTFSTAAWAAFNVPCDSNGPAGTPFVRGTNCRTVTVDGVAREYIVYVPKSGLFQFSIAAPVVMHFHGSGGNASGTFGENGWWQKSEEIGFVAVMGSALPYFDLSDNAFKTHWNNLTLDDGVDPTVKPPGYPATAPWPADDVKFTDAMLADAKAGVLVDPRRIYISGFSSGAGMVQRLAVDRSQIFAAAGAAGSGSLAAVYDPLRNMPLYYAIGNKDGHLLDAVNNAPDGPKPPLNQLPLKYNQLFRFTPVQNRFNNLTATYGVSNVPTDIIESPAELRTNYLTPLAGNVDHNEVIVSIQGDVTHQYPRGSDNLNGFDDTTIFWNYFQEHPLATTENRHRVVRH
jgi:poly(3-hydroxybutyrate) depolymerase